MSSPAEDEDFGNVELKLRTEESPTKVHSPVNVLIHSPRKNADFEAIEGNRPTRPYKRRQSTPYTMAPQHLAEDSFEDYY